MKWCEKRSDVCVSPRLCFQPAKNLAVTVDFDQSQSSSSYSYYFTRNINTMLSFMCSKRFFLPMTQTLWRITLKKKKRKEASASWLVREEDREAAWPMSSAPRLQPLWRAAAAARVWLCTPPTIVGAILTDVIWINWQQIGNLNCHFLAWKNIKT